MGKNYKKSLHQQAHDRLLGMVHTGHSKKQERKEGISDGRIYSWETFQTYKQQVNDFCRYVTENHRECSSLNEARCYAGEWLQRKVDAGLSAWTVQTAAAAVNKLFGIRPGDEDRFKAPIRRREDAVRSRVECARDKHFSVTNNDELIRFCKGTGLRRKELEDLKGKNLITRTDIDRLLCSATLSDHSRELLQDAVLCGGRSEYFVCVKCGKGGRQRITPVIGPDVSRIVERFRQTPQEEKVWGRVHSGADIHGYRAEYATALYRMNARRIEDIPFDRTNKGTGRRYQSEVYTCRKDESGRKLDKAAMLMCSKALGHNRISVVAESYLRGL